LNMTREAAFNTLIYALEVFVNILFSSTLEPFECIF
jgi:hypothetical protein